MTSAPSSVVPVSYGARLTQMATERPDETAFVFVSRGGDEDDVSWRQLDEASNRVARMLDEHEVGPGSTVVTALPNSVAHVVAMYGSWKAGACVLPLRSDLPGHPLQHDPRAGHPLGQRRPAVEDSSENAGIALANGQQWLDHPGMVGRPFHTEARIVDDEGADQPPGQVREIYLRWADPGAESFEYSGQVQARRTADGFSSLGDLGWLDGDGFLFLADRRTDMIISGGANVYPAEVEAALSEHPDVVDVAVVGRPDPEWGARVHAVVQLRQGEGTVAAEDLRAHCRDRLAAYKVPKTFEFTEQLPRSAAGKLRRSALSASGD